MQKVDALIDLILDDPVIRRDARILDDLRNSARRMIAHRLAGHRLEILPTLYRRYRGPSFPMKNREGMRLPPWRSLSPWMKVQMATLCLGERGYMQFTVHPHDGLVSELLSNGQDLKVYLRDRLKRCLRERFGEDPWFFFVVEDRSKTGREETRPHIHGSIEIRPVSLSRLKNGEYPVRFRKVIEENGVAGAERIYGRELAREALAAATGNSGTREPVVNGVHQARNVWCKKPYHRLFNSPWVDYSFKNVRRFSRNLGENRVAFSRPLNQEAQRLWTLVREGESAIDQWID
jgi:hypothetical protein